MQKLLLTFVAALMLAAGLAKHCDASIADIMEEALAVLAKAKKFRVGE